jgi:hypothetical protein
MRLGHQVTPARFAEFMGLAHVPWDIKVYQGPSRGRVIASPLPMTRIRHTASAN